MPRLKVITYNTYRERKGRDEVLGMLLEEDALVCLQELSIARAIEIHRRFGERAYVSPVMQGWEFLATVLPKNARFEERQTEQLNSFYGLLPRSWSLRRARLLRALGMPAWKDGLTPRAAQVSRVAWEGCEFRTINTHLPYEPGLRNRCLGLLPPLIGEGSALVAGDFNVTKKDVFMNDLLLASGLEPAGPETPTHDSQQRIDYVLYRGRFREMEYDLRKSRSDHRIVCVELEVS